MASEADALNREFVRLRHGRGLADSGLRARLGPRLIVLCGIVPGDTDRAIRTKVLATVSRLSANLPSEDRLAIDHALGGSQDRAHRLLKVRLEMLAAELNCAERTARRRVEDAFGRLAEEAIAVQERDPDVDDDNPETGWYVRRLDALLRLDTATPEVAESRTIVAQRAHLQRIVARFTVPPEATSATMNVYADIAHGARIESVEREGDSHFRVVLALPRPLAVDESHTYTIIFRIPPGQTMRPHYALIPLSHTESFHVCARFDPEHRPERVVRFERLAPRMVDDRTVAGTLLPLDDADEVEAEFTDVERGYAYGISWRS